MANVIDSFRGAYSFLSNFYPCTVVFNNICYRSSESAYQAHKSSTARGMSEFILLDAEQSKKLGRKIEMRPDWERVKITIMYQIVLAKFSQHTDLAKKLVETGDAELIEGNTWNDTFWGVCNGEGQNWLGKILMEVRKVMKATGIANVTIPTK